MQRRLALFLAFFAAFTLYVAAYTQDNPETPASNLEITESVEPTATPFVGLPGSVGPYTYPEIVNPLTGLIVNDPTTLERRPMVVKISNAPPLVRPQSGISEADIVFEHYAEGGLTRFSAVFYGNAPTRVGSIRSARLIDHELTAMFHGILAFSGASIGVEKYIYGSEDVASRVEGADTVAPHGLIPPSEYAGRAYKGVLYGQPLYWRDENIPVPHNLFTNVAAIWERAAEEGHAQKPPLQGLAFHDEIPDGSSGAVSEIDIRYRATRVLWQYDPETGLYHRFADGIGHFDANTETQITAANVVVMYAEHVDTDIVESVWQDNVSWSTRIAVWGENDVVLFRDGQRYDGRWTRTIREHIISLRTSDGEMLYLKPGNTWFQIIRNPEQQNPDEEWLITE